MYIPPLVGLYALFVILTRYYLVPWLLFFSIFLVFRLSLCLLLTNFNLLYSINSNIRSNNFWEIFFPFDLEIFHHAFSFWRFTHVFQNCLAYLSPTSILLFFLRLFILTLLLKVTLVCRSINIVQTDANIIFFCEPLVLWVMNTSRIKLDNIDIIIDQVLSNIFHFRLNFLNEMLTKFT